MNRKILVPGIVVILVILLLFLTGCGTSENIKLLQEAEFHNWRGDTGFTYKEAMEQVMSNVKWSEYSENDTIYIKITGKEKETGNKIEIIFSKLDEDSFKKEEIIVNGEPEFSIYFTNMFTNI